MLEDIGLFRHLLERHHDDRHAGRAQDPPELGHRLTVVGNVLQNVKAQDQVERMIGKIDVADINSQVDVRLEEIAGLIGLDPFLADIGGQARLGREVEHVLALENGLLVGADGGRPMTRERKT